MGGWLLKLDTMRMFIKNLMTSLVWLYIFVVFIPMFVLFVLLWAVTRPFDRRLVALHWLTCVWGWLYFVPVPLWRLSIFDRHKFNRHKVYVVVSNHQSMVDITAIKQLFRHFKWVIKSELFDVPFFGIVLRLNRYIRIRRSSPRSMRQMLDDSIAAIRQGSSIMIFPEGTRTPDGHLQKFRTGAFKIALETQTSILPMVIDGTHTILPKDGFALTGGHRVKLRVLDEIPYDTFKDMDENSLANYVQGIIAEGLTKLRSA